MITYKLNLEWVLCYSLSKIFTNNDTIFKVYNNVSSYSNLLSSYVSLNISLSNNFCKLLGWKDGSLYKHAKGTPVIIRHSNFALYLPNKTNKLYYCVRNIKSLHPYKEQQDVPNKSLYEHISRHMCILATFTFLRLKNIYFTLYLWPLKWQ